MRPAYPFFACPETWVWPFMSSGPEAGGEMAASRDILRPNCFHGPGESPANRGDGKGVRSPMAAMTGLATVELAAEAEPKGP